MKFNIIELVFIVNINHFIFKNLKFQFDFEINNDLEDLRFMFFKINSFKINDVIFEKYKNKIISN